MAKVICPNCESPAINVSLIRGRKCYCARCGWNVGIARTELRSDIKVALGIATVGVILAIIARVRSPRDWTGALIMVLAFSGLPGIWAVGESWQLRKLKTVLPGANIKRPSSDPTSNKTYSDSLALVRPRKLRMTWRGRLYLLFVVLAVGLWTYFGLPALWNVFHGTRSGNTWITLFWSAMVYGYSFIFLRNRVRERQLISNGEFATGYVLKQTNGRYSQTVEYSFQDTTGNTITGRSTDASRSLYEGMSTSIFYDPFDPKRNVSLDCSLTKIDIR